MDGGRVKKSVWTLFMGDPLFYGSITQLKFVKKTKFSDEVIASRIFKGDEYR